ncbi:PAAR domain-containing protein [Burkholderia cenocepacia]|uniref:PAAR domain-containing protein n=1 Tax=Burkholderia cenocepacia TaxID=95486 RepID=UPI0038BDBE77
MTQFGKLHSHGSRIESGAINSETMCRPAARVGDRRTCPIHGGCLILEGDEDFNVEACLVAFDSNKTTSRGSRRQSSRARWAARSITQTINQSSIYIQRIRHRLIQI